MIAVGRVSKSVGVKGELGVSPLTDDPRRFTKLKSVWIGGDESTAERFSVSSVRRVQSTVVLTVKEIDSRAAADGRRGEYIFVSEKDSVAPRKGSYFIHEIIGLEVVTESGDRIGIVRDVMKLPAHDVWIVHNGTKEILIPATKEIIRSVDVKRSTVVIRPLEGLLE